MEIKLEGIGKKYGRQWIFRNLDFVVEPNSATAITGHNGSGKSTLLQIVSSFTDPTTGKVIYSQPDPIPHISYVAPYLELIEELTLLEHLDFHFTFKKATIPFDLMIQRAELAGAEHKSIGEFSSGMKQRLKLLLAFYTQTSLICLDEPTSNLDEQGIQWYQREVMNQKGNRTIIIASNQRFEYNFCNQAIDLTRYKVR